jgi:predicted DNA-binding transcriptional regulator YafY
VAWDLERHDWRTFRVDRLDHPVPTRVRFRPRELPRGDAATFVRDRIAAVPTKYRVVVTIDAPAADVARVVGPWGVVEPLEPRSCRWTINADTLDWPTFVLAAVGAEFTVLEPPELHDHLRRTSELFARGAKSSTAS